MTARTLHEIAAEITALFGPKGAQMQWASEEIAAAQQRHPAAADDLYHSWILLTPPEHPLMKREPVYRSYCRELLDRVASGRDTRPATAIEVLFVMSAASLEAPLNAAATGLYLRVWAAAGLEPASDSDVAELAYYEAREGSQMNEYEAQVRRRATRPGRILDREIDCDGWHGGKAVRCKYSHGPKAGRPAA